MSRNVHWLTRQHIFERDNYTCRACGFTDESGRGLAVDHIHPVAKGGEDTEDNLQCLCGPCNLIKGSKEAPGLAIRKKADMNVTLREAVDRVEANRLTFYETLNKGRKSGWYSRQEKTINLIKEFLETGLGQVRFKRLAEAIKQTFKLRKRVTFITIRERAEQYLALVLKSTPTDDACVMAY